MRWIDSSGWTMYYKPDWAEARKRIEAWWSGEVMDRVAIAVWARGRSPFGVTPIQGRRSQSKYESS
jgi:hypothetical protein